MRALSIAVAMLSICLCAGAFAQAEKPVAQVNHAVIISVDGMRSDLALRANMPNMRKMLERGAFSFWARSTEVSITLPTHTSMLTGMPPEVHGIWFNDDGPVEPVHPKVLSIFDYAKKAGYTTAMTSGKSKLGLIPQTADAVDYSVVPARGKGGDNLSAATAAVSILKEHRPGLLFVHLTDTDGTGHGKGWGTPEQIAEFEEADQCLGMIFDALEEQKLSDSTIVILTADHGGRQKWHGANDPRARHIPWIVVGPGIQAGLDLDSIREKQVNVEDTFATACTMLGIQTEPVFGRMVGEILQKQPAPAAKPVQSVIEMKPEVQAPAAAGKK